MDVDENIDKESKRFEDKQSSILQFRTLVMSWINQAENALFDDVSTHSRSSGPKSVGSGKSKSSKHSQASSTSSTLTAKSMEKAKIAELLVEKSMLQLKLQLQSQQEELKIDTAIAKAKAREKVYSDEQYNNIDTLPIVNVVDSVSNVPHNPVASLHVNPSSTVPHATSSVSVPVVSTVFHQSIYPLVTSVATATTTSITTTPIIVATSTPTIHVSNVSHMMNVNGVYQTRQWSNQNTVSPSHMIYTSTAQTPVMTSQHKVEVCL